jgi:predicted transcriptional regulator
MGTPTPEQAAHTAALRDRLVALCHESPRTTKELRDATNMTSQTIKGHLAALRKGNRVYNVGNLGGTTHIKYIWATKPKAMRFESVPILTVWRGPLPTDWRKP